MVKWVNCSQSMPENSETRYIMKMRQVNGTFMVRKCFGQNFWGYIESRKINPKRLNWMPFTPEDLDWAINNIQLNGGIMTNKELIDLLKCYPQDAEVQIMNAGSWDDGERGGYDPAWKEIDPEEDLTYDSNTNELTIGTFG